MLDGTLSQSQDKATSSVDPQSLTRERREASITDLKYDQFTFVVLRFAMRKAVTSHSSCNQNEFATLFTKL